MARPELGTKRTCPETGRKFYDLNRDPVVSPYTGVSYPLAYFEGSVRGAPEAEAEEDVEETVASGDVELVSLDDAEPAEKKGASDADPDIDLDDDGDDPFLPDDDEESDDDVSDLIDSDIDDDEDT